MALLKHIIFLCFVVSFIESYVVKSPQVFLSPEGLVIKVVIKPIKEASGVEREVKEGKQDGPELTTREGFIVGTCPTGFVKVGTFCFSDYEDEENEEVAGVEGAGVVTQQVDGPELTRRKGIIVGHCPTGYVKVGSFCFNEYESEDEDEDE